MLKSREYIDKLQEALEQSDNFSIVSTEEIGYLLDIVVTDKRGDDIYIKVKDAGSYGQLPLACIFHIKEVKEKYPRMLLISFSKIRIALQEAFRNIGVEFLIKPTIEDAMRKLTEMREQYCLKVVH
jgi:hypothetical protein